MVDEFLIRPASRLDHPALSKFLDSAPRSFRHLDWCPPLDWLGSQPFIIMYSDEGIQAALVCPEDPPGIAWIRYFSCAAGVNPVTSWSRLFDACLAYYSHRQNPWLAGLGLSDWFTNVLRRHGFVLHQHIVSLERVATDPLPAFEPNPSITIRLMEPADLTRVAQVDQLAFEPIWQNSLKQVELAYNLSVYATVAEIADQVVGFQISTSNVFSYHLARLAVLPEIQHQMVGQTLVADLIERTQKDRIWDITINTQDDNHASLALYKKIGFSLTGDHIPVFVYPFD